MRAYFYGNMYLSSIQQGIQGLHSTSEMFVKYRNTYNVEDDKKSDMLYTWAEHFKTVVLLNAGYADEIRKLIKVFGDKRNPYPWAEFYEGKDSLDGALTDVGIILPVHVYDTFNWVLPQAVAVNNTKIVSQGKDILSLDWRHAEDVYHLANDRGQYITTPISRWEFEFAQMSQNYSLAR